jgi:MarR family transcriptional regulator, transcriptional regulator for hemolysin
MPERPQDAIGFVLLTAARLLRARFERDLAAAELSLTPSDARALVLLGVLGPVRQSALAEVLTVGPMALVGTLDRLQARGLIAREPDGRDGRAKLVRLTKAAAPLQERALSVLGETRRHALRRFSPAESETLRRLLQRLCDDLATESEDVAR